MGSDEHIHVKVIGKKSETALVEFMDGDELTRVVVPRSEIGDGDTVSIEALEMGIPWGVPWAQVVRLRATPRGIEQKLHEHGIWTVLDLQVNVKAAVGVFQAVYGVDALSLLSAARRYERDRED